MPKFYKPMSIALTILVTLTASLFAQVSVTLPPLPPPCPLPDGLSFGPCCTPAQLTLPKFPGFVQDSFNICWRDCDVEDFSNCRAEWSAPRGIGLFGTPPTCGQFLARLRLLDAAGTLKWRGVLNLNYSRTWLEVDTAGDEYQVWRFLVNGDLKPTADAGLSPCPVPPCAASFGNRVRYTGYLDYAQNCGTGTFSFAWMLQHSCDVIDHAANFPRSGFFHFNRAYTFVGPSAGFAIGPIQPIASGGTSLEAVRRVRLPTPTVAGDCEYDEQIDAGLEVLQELCLCGFPTAPLQYAISDLGLGSSCATTIFTPGGPLLPGYISMGIGAWTDPTAYPGLETLRWSTGGYDYFDPCTGVTRQEVFFGVTTLGGYFAATVPPVGGASFPLPLSFVDQANSLRKGSSLTIMNIAFESDHFLNLNFE